MLKKLLSIGAFSSSVALMVPLGSLHASEPDAMQILKSATDLIESSQSISVQGIATADQIDDDIMIQKNFTLEVMLQRPDKIMTRRTGDENQQSYFNGNTLTVVNTKKNLYGQKDAMGNLDDLVNELQNTNISAPLADLILTNFYELASKAIKTSKYIGVSDIGGQSCHHLSFKTSDVDWQVWVATGDVPTLCRSLITSSLLAGAPQYQVTFSNWQLNMQTDVNMFEFTPPEGASRVELTPEDLQLND